MTIAERLSVAISQSGYSFEALGEMSGIAKSSLQRYASGNTKKIPVDAIEKIAPFLGVSASYLMGWDEEKRGDALRQNTANEPKNNDDPDIRRIQRARNNMSPKDKDRMMNILKASFEDYFDDENN